MAAPPPPSSIVHKSARAACWAARDAYIECASAHGPVPEAGRPTVVPKACGAARAAFEAACPKSWVLHFDTLRVKEAEFARKVQAAVKQSVVKGAAAGNLAGERQPTKD